MTAAPARPRLVELDARDLADRLDEALHVYVAAMGYPPGTARQRRSLWLDHSAGPAGGRSAGSTRPARCSASRYGYTGRSGPVVVRGGPPGCVHAGPGHGDDCDDYFELTELHVRPDAQGGGLGEGLLRALLAGTDRPTCCCRPPSTARGHAGRAWQLYRRLGFRDVLRDHLFTGDPRPFAVLGRELPLPPPAARPEPRRAPDRP